jgi:c-di-GMP-binding flagellar brake protein YcgR
MERARTGKERRKDLRVNIFEPFLIKFQVSKGGILRLYSKRYAPSSNISASGILVELPGLSRRQIDRLIENRDKLIIELDIPLLRKPLKTQGKIVWLEKRHRGGKTVNIAGISFETIKEKDREKLLLLLIYLCLKSKIKI